MLTDPRLIKDSVVKAPTTLKDKEVQVLQKLDERRQTLGQRFPLPFAMFATFGLVATYYGFEHIIDQIDLFANNPVILLTVGIITLGLTGTLYKKLG